MYFVLSMRVLLFVGNQATLRTYSKRGALL
jgi:hypothetical protein